MTPAVTTLSLSAGRLLTLLTAGALLIAEMLLGAEHALTSCGLIAFVAALMCALGRNGVNKINVYELLLSVVVGACVAYGVYLFNWQARVAALMPALFQAILATLVGRSLTAGRVPFIHRIGAAMQPDGQPLPPEVARYARRSTWLWLIIFSGLAVFNAIAALSAWRTHSAPLALGLIDVAVAACIILFEFFYRRWRFTSHSNHTLLEFWRGLLQLNPVRILLS